MASKIKIGYRDTDSLNKIMQYMINKGHDFTYREIGKSTVELQLPIRRIKSKNTKNFFAGSHLSRLVILNIQKRLKDGLYKPINQDNERKHVNTVMFDKENILKFINHPIVAIDINSCYWNTAKIIGAISQEIYEKGMSGGDDWKKARNASIGSLNTLIKEYKPFDGKLQLTKMYRRPFNIVRLDIVDYVWKIANEIAYEVQDGFCMFLTDCFFVTKNYESKIYELLKQYGYSGKSQNILYESAEEIKNVFKVQWGNKYQIGKDIVFLKRHIVKWKR